MVDQKDVEACFKQGQRLLAERTEVEARYIRAKTEGDEFEMGQLQQHMADLDAAGQNLNAFYNGKVAEASPPAQPELSREEIEAKPWDKMTPQDGLDLARTSKYGKDLDFKNADVIAGVKEVMRRRQQGR